MIWNVRFQCQEAALPAGPLLLVALMLPVTLVLLGLVNRRTTRNKFCLLSFGSTCTVTLTSLCRDKSDNTADYHGIGWNRWGGYIVRRKVKYQDLRKRGWLISREQAKVKRGKYSQRNAGPSLTVTARVKVSFIHHQHPRSHLCIPFLTGSGVAHYNMEKARKTKGKR